MLSKELEEINFYCDPASVLIVTNKKRLLRLLCPFKVEVIQDLHAFKRGTIVEVDAVKIDLQFRLVYVIQQQYYLHKHFRILFEDH
jgi:hypothetical protein